MSDQQEIKIYICMNELGEYEVGADQEDTETLLNDNFGGGMRRTVCITTAMAPPIAAEVSAPAVPDEVGTTGPIEAA